LRYTTSLRAPGPIATILLRFLGTLTVLFRKSLTTSAELPVVAG